MSRCRWCQRPIPVPAGRTRVPPHRVLCGRTCYDAERRSRPIDDRFWSHVRKSAGCWEWTSALGASGYGTFGVTRRRQMPAHRFSWVLAFGPIPAGLFVCHHCDNPKCVRPDHLFLGTPLANTSDMIRKGRQRTRPLPGEANPNARLTEDQVREIRRRRDAGEVGRLVAADFGVTPELVYQIGRRKAWRHVA